MAPRWRVLLIGLGETALSALNSLSDRILVVGVIRPAAAGATGPDVVLARAKSLGVPIFSDASPAAISQTVLDLRPDCVVVSSYDRIISPGLLRRVPFVNVHYSPLPEYRGRANVNWAIINNEAHTAISIHVIAPELDAGNILFQEKVPILPEDTAGTLYAKLNTLQHQHLAAAVERFLAGDPGTPQPEGRASYGCTRLPADGHIDWSAPTGTIARLVRALDRPFPGAYTYLGERKLIIWGAKAVENPRNYAGRIAGRVVSTSAAEGHVDVLTGDGVLRLAEVQLEGEEPTPAGAVIRSVRVSLGLSVESLLTRIRQLEERLRPDGPAKKPTDKGSGS
ncbi:MAG: methionyl-tRNA formyltransferase [Gammaproteobacteria bacterium]|nr:methionyl-tRNA formyltransferase [Gammaproteobacteria bacterium]